MSLPVPRGNGWHGLGGKKRGGFASGAAGPARSEDLDARLEELLRFLVHMLRQRHAWWRHRLVSVLGRPLGSPAEVRRRIELRLFIFGASRGRRKYARVSAREQLLKELEEAFGRILAGEAPGPAESPEEKAKEAGEAKRTQET